MVSKIIIFLILQRLSQEYYFGQRPFTSTRPCSLFERVEIDSSLIEIVNESSENLISSHGTPFLKVCIFFLCQLQFR